MPPRGLEIVGWIWLVVSFVSSGAVTIDVWRHRQKMAVMNAVWPINCLWGGPVVAWLYRRVGRKSARDARSPQPERSPGKKQRRAQRRITRAQVVVSTLHCGTGCSLGDIVGEWWMFVAPQLWLGSLGTRFFWDFVLAWSFGVVFQYFSIVPMRGLGVGQGVRTAIKADTLSIVAFQAGMYGWQTLVYTVFFSNPHLPVDSASFWFEMQIAMAIGFLTSYPMNRWLIARGWKERMPSEPAAAAALDSRRAA